MHEISWQNVYPIDVLRTLSTDEWKELSEMLKGDENYKPRNFGENLDLLLIKLGFDIKQSYVPAEIINGKDFTKKAAFLLADHQLDTFDKLLEEKL